MQTPKSHAEQHYVDDDLPRILGPRAADSAEPAQSTYPFNNPESSGDSYSLGQTSNGWVIYSISTEIYGDETQSWSFTYPYATTYSVPSSIVPSFIYFSTSSQAVAASSTIPSSSVFTTVVTKTKTTAGVFIVSSVVTSIATISIEPKVAPSVLPPTPTSIATSTPQATHTQISNSHDTAQLTHLQWIGIALGIFFFLLLIIALIGFRRCTSKKRRVKAEEMRCEETVRNGQAEQTQLQGKYRPRSPPPTFEAAISGGEELKEKVWQGTLYVDGRDQRYNGIAEVDGRQSERRRVEMPAEGIAEIG